MPEPEWLDDDEMRFWRAFIAAWPTVLGPIEADLKDDADLTFDDYEVLVHLSEAPNRRLRMSELGERLLHSRSRLTQRVDRLASRGLVCREKCPDDKRSTFTVLTDTGFAVLEAAAPGHVASVRRHLLAKLSATDVRRGAAILAKLVDDTGGVAVPPDG